MSMLSLDEGKTLVRITRDRIRSHLQGKAYVPEEAGPFLRDKSGVFVTLNTYPDKNLRGCIGFPEPVYPLIDALLDAAIASATNDPRFYPVKLKEIDNIVIEVTVLSSPELITGVSGRGYLDAVEIGRDGLIVEKGFYKGLLLPQVPIEWNWKKEEFLSHTCIKAGLPPDSWLNDDDIKIYRFSGQIFSEREPGGNVVELQR
ncbi:MAG: TIGR00296 family protein [Candidatus Methanofastidiosa archaeon]|nr:TIGR00296 family protein [Candidatus Methanofastidiosa archaeon]